MCPDNSILNKAIVDIKNRPMLKYAIWEYVTPSAKPDMHNVSQAAREGPSQGTEGKLKS